MTEEQLLKKLGLKIKQLRTKKGMSQRNFGYDIEMEKSNVSRMESGVVNIKIGNLYKVAKALEITLPQLLDV